VVVDLDASTDGVSLPVRDGVAKGPTLQEEELRLVTECRPD